MLATILAVLLFASLALLGYLYFSASKSEENTREQYAFKCLGAIVTLAALCITTISSKQSIMDQMLALGARLVGSPISDAPPVPISEHILLFIVFLVVVVFVWASHESWEGKISVDEEERRRMKRSTGLFFQAADEISRLVQRKPERKVYVVDKRVDPVAIPNEPNLVWHDQSRELFELWMPTSIFNRDSPVAWNQREKCWHGRDRATKKEVFLLCDDVHFDSKRIDAFKAYVRSVTSESALLYVIVKQYPIGLQLLDGYAVQGEVTWVSEEFLFERIVDFSDYCRDVFRRVEKDTFADSDRVIKDIYTPSSLSCEANGSKVVSTDFGGYLSEWAKRPAGKQIAVMGEYGQGKSTGALMYVYDAFNSNFESSGGRIPVLIELRGKSPANLSPAELLGAWGQQYQLQASALMKLLIAGRLIVIFEGFDEMANIASSEIRMAHFRSLWRFSYPKSKIVFTGRRNLFFEDSELHVVFRGTAERASGPLCEILHLCPFDSEKINLSLRWLPSIDAEEIVEAAHSNPQIFDIVSRPALLYIVASLWEEMRALLKQDGVASAQVIDRFVMHSYARQEAKESELGFMRLTKTERRYFHEGVAVYMASKGSTNQVTAPDLRAAIERLYKSYPERAHISELIMGETDRPPLRVRFPEDDNTIEAVLADVRTHGILVNDLGQRGAFRFAHKSFYEMLAAKAQAYSLLDREPMFYRSIKHAMDGEVESVSTKTPEMLNFLSEFIVFHLRQLHGASGVALPAFDIIVGVRRPVLFFRRFKLIIIALLHNRYFRRCSLGVMGAAVALTFLASTEFGRSLLGLSLKIDNTNEVGFSWKGALSFILSSTGFIFLWYYMYASTIILQKSRLWVAVLVSADNSTHSVSGLTEIINIFGKSTAQDIVLKAGGQYSVFPINCLGLNIPTQISDS
ncbi:NACHT domain-containing protein [Pseudomonas fluorescens]|uniref:NACHT domain-containing protein n=1 Tax=Pseudomonas fluorescens TaxID=294 RepID=UPI001A9F5F6C|nr:hypothetical protein [Pseudomonas fluorescens]QTD34656.1 hypothetical protein JZM58_07295 [Pseudomonas fluorescens]